MIVTRKVKDIDNFVQKTSRKVTKSPVFTRISKKPFKNGEDVARLVRYKPIKKGLPMQYEVLFCPKYVKTAQLRTLKKISAHELAHIKYPHKHTREFQKEAKRLGAENRSIACGVERVKRFVKR